MLNCFETAKNGTYEEIMGVLDVEEEIDFGTKPGGGSSMLGMLCENSKLSDAQRIECVTKLIESLPETITVEKYVNLKNKLGRTALHSAAGFNRDNVVQFILDLGAKIDFQDNYGNSPLMFAVAFGGNGSAISMLISKGANTSLKNSSEESVRSIMQNARTSVEYSRLFDPAARVSEKAQKRESLSRFERLISGVPERASSCALIILEARTMVGEHPELRPEFSSMISNVLQREAIVDTSVLEEQLHALEEKPDFDLTHGDSADIASEMMRRDTYLLSRDSEDDVQRKIASITQQLREAAEINATWEAQKTELKNLLEEISQPTAAASSAPAPSR